jgi:hypothetical protein
MRFLMMHKLDQHDADAWTPKPDLVKQMGAFMEEAVNKGVMLAGEGVLPPQRDGALMRFSDGEATVTDGPFAEAKEVIAGFALLNVEDKAEALVWAERFGKIIGGDIEVEVRRVAEFSDFPEDVFGPEERAREQGLRDQLAGA